MESTQRADEKLLAAVREALPRLEALLAENSGEWTYADPVYRFYHGSYKVYGLQGATLDIVEALRSLAPECELHPFFAEILAAGTGKRFAYEHNRDWTKHTRPIVEAFFHARFFLEMAVRCGHSMEQASDMLPSDWAALLYLYQLR